MVDNFAFIATDEVRGKERRFFCECGVEFLSRLVMASHMRCCVIHRRNSLRRVHMLLFVWFAPFNHFFFESSLLTGAKEQSGKSCNAEEEGSSLGVRESRQGRELTLVLALNCLPTD